MQRRFAWPLRKDCHADGVPNRCAYSGSDFDHAGSLRKVSPVKEYEAEAERLGKQSFAIAYYMDRQKEPLNTKEFYTEKWHYTSCDSTGHRESIRNKYIYMIASALRTVMI